MPKAMKTPSSRVSKRAAVTGPRRTTRSQTHDGNASPLAVYTPPKKSRGPTRGKKARSPSPQRREVFVTELSEIGSFDVIESRESVEYSADENVQAQTSFETTQSTEMQVVDAVSIASESVHGTDDGNVEGNQTEDDRSDSDATEVPEAQSQAHSIVGDSDADSVAETQSRSESDAEADYAQLQLIREEVQYLDHGDGILTPESNSQVSESPAQVAAEGEVIVQQDTQLTYINDSPAQVISQTRTEVMVLSSDDESEEETPSVPTYLLTQTVDGSQSSPTDVAATVESSQDVLANGAMEGLVSPDSDAEAVQYPDLKATPTTSATKERILSSRRSHLRNRGSPVKTTPRAASRTSRSPPSRSERSGRGSVHTHPQRQVNDMNRMTFQIEEAYEAKGGDLREAYGMTLDDVAMLRGGKAHLEAFPERREQTLPGEYQDESEVEVTPEPEDPDYLEKQREEQENMARIRRGHRLAKAHEENRWEYRRLEGKGRERSEAEEEKFQSMKVHLGDYYVNDSNYIDRHLRKIEQQKLLKEENRRIALERRRQQEGLPAAQPQDREMADAGPSSSPKGGTLPSPSPRTPSTPNGHLRAAKLTSRLGDSDNTIKASDLNATPVQASWRPILTPSRSPWMSKITDSVRRLIPNFFASSQATTESPVEDPAPAPPVAPATVIPRQKTNRVVAQRRRSAPIKPRTVDADKRSQLAEANRRTAQTRLRAQGVRTQEAKAHEAKKQGAKKQEAKEQNVRAQEAKAQQQESALDIALGKRKRNERQVTPGTYQLIYDSSSDDEASPPEPVKTPEPSGTSKRRRVTGRGTFVSKFGEDLPRLPTNVHDMTYRKKLGNAWDYYAPYAIKDLVEEMEDYLFSQPPQKRLERLKGTVQPVGKGWAEGASFKPWDLLKWYCSDERIWEQWVPGITTDEIFGHRNRTTQSTASLSLSGSGSEDLSMMLGDVGEYGTFRTEAEKAATKKQLEKTGHVPGVSIFCAPVDSDDEDSDITMLSDAGNDAPSTRQSATSMFGTPQSKAPSTNLFGLSSGANSKTPSPVKQRAKSPSKSTEGEKLPWDQAPPPRPTPAHASLPGSPQKAGGDAAQAGKAAAGAALNGSAAADSDALKRARSQAEKYKPKQPSGLRASSHLSAASTAASDDAAGAITAPAGTGLGDGLLAQSVTPALKPKFSIHISTVGEVSPNSVGKILAPGAASSALPNGTTALTTAASSGVAAGEGLENVPAEVLDRLGGHFGFARVAAVPAAGVDADVRRELEGALDSPKFGGFAVSRFGQKLAV